MEERKGNITHSLPTHTTPLSHHNFYKNVLAFPPKNSLILVFFLKITTIRPFAIHMFLHESDNQSFGINYESYKELSGHFP